MRKILKLSCIQTQYRVAEDIATLEINDDEQYSIVCTYVNHFKCVVIKGTEV